MGRIIIHKNKLRKNESRGSRDYRYYKEIYDYLRESTGIPPEDIPRVMEETAQYLINLKVASLSRLYNVPEDFVVSTFKESGYDVKKTMRILESVNNNTESEKTQFNESSNEGDIADKLTNLFLNINAE